MAFLKRIRLCVLRRVSLEPALAVPAAHWPRSVFNAHRRKFFAAFLPLLLLSLVLPEISRSQNPSAEYKLKAVFLYNFVQFVDWPSNVFSDKESPFIIGVLGEDPFGKVLDDTVKDEVIKGRNLEVRRYRNLKEIGECHVLFISRSEESKLASILAGLKGRSILTVGDVDNFANKGGMIRFVKDQNKIRFRVNVESAKAANLNISSKLLQLSEIVPAQRRP